MAKRRKQSWDTTGKNHLQIMEDAIRRQRKHAPMYDWPDKTQKELGIARDFNTHYETIVGCAVAKTTPREKGKDPPDIDLSFENGELVGLEITELVDEQAILATEHTNTAHYPLWPDAELHASITKLVEKRTGRENGKAVLTPDTFC